MNRTAVDIPKLLVHMEINGEVIRTKLINLMTVAKALNRKPKWIHAFLGLEMCVQTQLDLEKNCYSLDGYFAAAKLQSAIEDFAKIFVFCPSCQGLQTAMTVFPNKIQCTCFQCSFVGPIKSSHKLVNFIRDNTQLEKYLQGSKEINSKKLHTISLLEEVYIPHGLILCHPKIALSKKDDCDEALQNIKKSSPRSKRAKKKASGISVFDPIRKTAEVLYNTQIFNDDGFFYVENKRSELRTLKKTIEDVKDEFVKKLTELEAKEKEPDTCENTRSILQLSTSRFELAVQKWKLNQEAKRLSLDILALEDSGVDKLVPLDRRIEG